MEGIVENQAKFKVTEDKLSKIRREIFALLSRAMAQLQSGYEAIERSLYDMIREIVNELFAELDKRTEQVLL